MKWIYLIIAIVGEMIATSSLKERRRFHKARTICNYRDRVWSDLLLSFPVIETDSNRCCLCGLGRCWNSTHSTGRILSISSKAGYSGDCRYPAYRLWCGGHAGLFKNAF